MFKKPKNVRTRGPVELVEDEQEDQDEDVVEIQASITKLKKEKKKKKDKDRDKDKKEEKKTSLLSFEDDAGEEVIEFKVKKSSASRRLMKQKGRERKPSEEKEEPAAKENGTGRSGAAGASLTEKIGISVVDDDVGIVYKEEHVQTWTLSGREAEALHAEEEDAEANANQDEDEDEDPIKKIIQSGGIPDAAAIHAARKKRELLRAKGGQEDYVPLKVKPVSKAAPEEDKKMGKRLVREEDEEEDDEDRISFTKDEKKEEYHRKVVRDAESSEDEGEGSWEKMQIRKAMTGQQMSAAVEEVRITEKWVGGGGGMVGGANGRSPGPSLIPQAAAVGPPIPRPAKYDLKGIRDRMKQRMETLRETSRRHEMDADRAVDDLVESRSEISRLEEEVPRLAGRYRVFQQLRGYITDLVDCYDEKLGSISYLESRLNKMYEETRGKLRERRRQDVRDQADMLAAQAANSGFTLNMDLVQDAMRDYRVAEREGRQRRRRQARQNKGILRHNEGLSSDDEMPGQDLAGLAKMKQDVENQARLLMEDVVEEFSVIANLQEKLIGWREDDPNSYKSAYVSLCLPKIFSPLIRFQLLFWNPFTSEQELEDQGWYRDIATYGLESEEDLTSLLEDPDKNLLSLCVEKVIIPKVSEIVRCSYDPMSTSQTTRLIGLLNRLVSDFPSLTMKSKFLRGLLAHVVELIKDSLDQDVYIPMYTKNQMDTPSTPHSLFFYRQFWSALKLYRNILAWQGILADSVMMELALDRLLNRYILLSLRANHDVTDAIDKARIVTDSLPQVWLDRAERGGKEGEKFSMMTKFLATAGSTVGLPRDAVQEAARIARKLGDLDTSEKLKKML